jgi:hypothetical protein
MGLRPSGYVWLAARKPNPEKSPSRTCFPELFIELDQPEDLRERSPALEADLGDTLERKKVVRVPQTQKSLSMAGLVELRRLAVCSRYALRSAARKFGKIVRSSVTTRFG